MSHVAWANCDKKKSVSPCWMWVCIYKEQWCRWWSIHAKWFGMAGEHHSHIQTVVHNVCRVTNSTCCKVVHDVLSDWRIHKVVCPYVVGQATQSTHTGLSCWLSNLCTKWWSVMLNECTLQSMYVVMMMYAQLVKWFGHVQIERHSCTKKCWMDSLLQSSSPHWNEQHNTHTTCKNDRPVRNGLWRVAQPTHSKKRFVQLVAKWFTTCWMDNTMVQKKCWLRLDSHTKWIAITKSDRCCWVGWPSGYTCWMLPCRRTIMAADCHPMCKCHASGEGPSIHSARIMNLWLMYTHHTPLTPCPSINERDAKTSTHVCCCCGFLPVSMMTILVHDTQSMTCDVVHAQAPYGGW